MQVSEHQRSKALLQRIRGSFKMCEQRPLRDTLQPERPAADLFEAATTSNGLSASGPPNSIVFRSAAGCRSPTAHISATSRKETQILRGGLTPGSSRRAGGISPDLHQCVQLSHPTCLASAVLANIVRKSSCSPAATRRPQRDDILPLFMDVVMSAFR
jgi:hypothetical protein